MISKVRRVSLLRSALSVFLVGALWAPAVQAETMRVCADPDNMPFSSKSKGSDPGVYVELAELIGKKLNMKIEYHWWLTVNQRRAMRYTIKEKKCDVTMALPASADYEVHGLERTNPFLNLSYGLVSAKSFKFNSLDDLKTVRLGAQFQTPPHVMLTVKGGYQVMSDGHLENLFAALENNEIDAFFFWGPVASYQNKIKHDSRWKITPVSGDDLEGAVAIGVREDKKNLVAGLNKALGELKPEIEKLEKKYAFPSGLAVDLDSLSLRKSANTSSSSTKKAAAATHVQVADASEKVPSAVATASDAVVVAAAEAAPEAAPGGKPMDADDKAGRVQFNDICSHCHSADGASPLKRRDLRLLKTRYGDEWLETAEKTMNEGLLDYGMPPWEGVLSDKQFVDILAFLKTIQK